MNVFKNKNKSLRSYKNANFIRDMKDVTFVWNWFLRKFAIIKNSELSE